MVSTVRVPGRGMASTRKGRAEVGQLRLSVAVTQVTNPLDPSLLRCLGGLASPIADNRLDQSRGWKADYTGSAAF